MGFVKNLLVFVSHPLFFRTSRRSGILVFLLSTVASYAFAVSSQNQLISLHVTPGVTTTRIVCLLKKPFHVGVKTTSDPAQLTIDFFNTELATSLNYSGSLIQSIHAQMINHDNLRVSFNLRNPAKVDRSSVQKICTKEVCQLALTLINPALPTMARASHDSVVVMQKTGAPVRSITELHSMSSAHAMAKTPVPQAQSQMLKKDEPVTPVDQVADQADEASPVGDDTSHGTYAVTLDSRSSGPKRNAVVIIDPGHGGKDPGATGQRGTHEKNIVLAIGKDLYDDLAAQKGITPVMTRNGDYFVTLRGRLQLARKGKGDLFMAIHADAFSNLDARGATVFALSEHGATSEAARWLAQKENYSELGGVSLSDKSYMLRSVLLDLSQTATIQDSLQFGYAELAALKKVSRLHENFVEQAPFMVLKSPDIPSLLIETGFISNRDEEAQLNDPSYQKQLASALAAGIVNYLQQNPPPQTYFSR